MTRTNPTTQAEIDLAEIREFASDRDTYPSRREFVIAGRRRLYERAWRGFYHQGGHAHIAEALGLHQQVGGRPRKSDGERVTGNGVE